MKRLFPAVSLFLLVLAAHSFAGSATWNLDPTSGDWNTAENWTPATVPNGPSDVATFAASSVNQVSFSASSTEVAEVVFDATATSSFNLTIGEGKFLTISGAGVVITQESLKMSPSAPITLRRSFSFRTPPRRELPM